MQAIYSLDDAGHPVKVEVIKAEFEKRDLQDQLEKNWNLLPGDLIAGTDNEPVRWVMIKREAPVESPISGETRWNLDFLFADDQAIPTFVECKLNKNSEARREIIGQMFEYVANAQHYWDFATLQGFVPVDFENYLWGQPAGQYLEDVLKNLKAGKVRLVLFMDEAPRELKSTVMFLNQALAEAEIMIVEAQQFCLGDKKFIVPNLFGYTEQVRADKERRSEKLAEEGGSAGKWTLERFNSAIALLEEPARSAVERLRDYVIFEKFSLSWGRGKSGSMNVIFPHLCPRSLFSVWSRGEVGINFGWMDMEVRSRLDADLRKAGFAYSEHLQYPSLSPQQWAGKVEALIAVIEGLKSYSVTKQ